ncbi:MAG: pyridoxal phosphate-dependent aminotransferase, partial [Proteobacteria bacterium]|nr:pyridoxal phosphate-dependent aminotransferase [Pseudomonadota bacterium]
LTQGIPELRKKIQNLYGYQDTEDYNCLITSGVSGGIMLAYLAMLDPGDEILIPDPYFVMYRDLATLINAKPVCYNTYPDFTIREEELEKSVSPKTKAIIISSPGNPTGCAMTASEIDVLVSFAKKHQIWIIFDEIYRSFCYDGEHLNCFKKYPNTLILNGFSKSHGVPGWRIGAAVGPNAIINEMIKLQQYTFVCTPSIVQWGLLEAFEIDFSKKLAEYKEKRDFIYNNLKDKYEIVKPSGAFYLFPAAPGGDGNQFVEKCIENNLLLVPGSVFSTRNSHFRLSFSAPMAQLERGVEVLRKLA